MRGARARHRWLLLVWPALVLALGLVGLVAPPASAAPAVPTITLIDDTNTTLSGDPFAGEEFAAQSAEYYDVGNPQATAWVCSVDFGDGTPPSGYWRSRFGAAPCAQFHTYAQPGTYTITMTVTDPSGASAQSSRVVTVTAGNVTQVDGGVEGSRVRLSAPAGSSTYAWSTPDGDQCVIASPTSRRTGVRCDDQGTFAFQVRGDSNATTGEYDVTYVNGAPQPTMQPTRYRYSERTQVGRQVVSPRVGTGDDLRWRVRAHDPSWRLAGAGLLGDDLTCHFDFGDGTTGDDADRTFDGCLGFHVYTRPGVYRAHVTVTDDSGAVGTASSTVTVVRRDVVALVRGHDTQLAGRASGRLTPAGTQGKVDLRLPSGRQVVGGVDRIEVLGGGVVELIAAVRVDGEPGYFVFVDINRRGPVAAQVQLDRGVYGRTDNEIVESAEATRPPFRTEVAARRIR